MDESSLPGVPAPLAAPGPAPSATAPRVPFHCSECGKSFRYRSDLRRHFARHTALKPHACPRCGKGFKHSFNLANHLRSHTGERPYRCSACPKGFRDSTGLLHHQVVHTGEKPYCCLVCELRFSSRSSLGRHLKRQHRGVLPSPLQPSPGLPPLNPPCSVCCNVGPCSVCGGGGAGGGEGLEGAGATSWGLAEAAAAAAASLPPFACGACARRFDHGRELAAHWAAHTDVKPFKCPRCERDFNAPALLERHKLTHDLQGSSAAPTQVWASGGGPEEVAGDVEAVEVGDAPPAWDAGLLLSPTGAGMPKLEALLPEGEGAENARAPAAAAEASSEDTLYQCDCGTFFASAPALASHLEAHSGPATYGCGHCGALYAALAALEEHRRASHGEGSGEAAPDGEGQQAAGGPGPGSSSRGKKIFGCSECEKLFRSPRDLERHVLVHTGEKPFPCLECGKFFRHECYLKRHRLLHGTERPFPCHICGKGFITLSNLSRHLKLHRGMD